MAVPSSGEISLGKIRQELQAANYTSGPYTAAATGLDPAENGTYATINTCSPYYPLSANPAKMSEWYGYDHDAPCPFATASYYFDGGLDGTDKLQTTNRIGNDPEAKLQADLTDKWTLSMWVAPDEIGPASQGAQGYQRLHGLWWIDDQSNGYICDISYNPYYTTGADNYLQLIISAGSGSSNNRIWQVELDSNGDNYSITQVASNDTWNINTQPGNPNANGFVHLVFVYDETQGQQADKLTVYWNGEPLKNMAAVGTGGPSNINYTGDQYWKIGQAHLGGLTTSAPGVWYGWIGWVSYANRFAATQTDVDTLYNSGTPPDPANIVNLYADMIHFELGNGQNGTEEDYNGLGIELTVTTADFTQGIYP